MFTWYRVTKCAFLENTRWHETGCAVGKITYILVKGWTHIFAVPGTPGARCRIPGKSGRGNALSVASRFLPGHYQVKTCHGAVSRPAGFLQGFSRQDRFPPGNFQVWSRCEIQLFTWKTPAVLVDLPLSNHRLDSFSPGICQGKTIPFTR